MSNDEGLSFHKCNLVRIDVIRTEINLFTEKKLSNEKPAKERLKNFITNRNALSDRCINCSKYFADRQGGYVTGAVDDWKERSNAINNAYEGGAKEVIDLLIVGETDDQ